MSDERILVVDGDAASLRLMTSELSAAGYDARGASDAAAALALLRRFAPRLVLVQIRTPGSDGLTLARLLKRDARTRHVRVVAVAVQAGRDDEARAVAAGCDGFLLMPSDPGTLRRLVSLYLADRSSEEVVCWAPAN